MSLSHRLPTTDAAGDPCYVYMPPPPHPGPPRQGVLTLFVAGLLDDVKPREIHNLFSHRPDFDHCFLEYTGHGNQAVAFVSFFMHQAALSAMAALNVDFTLWLSVNRIWLWSKGVNSEMLSS